MSIEVSASIYDYPKYYDLLFGSDVAAEFRFLKACFTKHAGCDVTRVFEPACGTGRLLISRFLQRTAEKVQSAGICRRRGYVQLQIEEEVRRLL